jgi:hypothetical protein
MTRARLGALLVTFFVTAGCGRWAGQWENWGVQDKQPEAEAAQVPTQAFVYQYVPLSEGQAFTALPGQAVDVGGRQWVASYGTVQIPRGLLKQVGSAAGIGISALSWDQPPYDRLYVPMTSGAYTELR